MPYVPSMLELVEMLVQLQWVAKDGDADSTCPVCSAYQVYGRHRPTCRLAELASLPRMGSSELTEG